MGFLKFPLCSLVLLVVILGLSAVAESKPYWGDIEVLKAMKNGLDIGSVRPGSCVSSWDFTVDPCDNLIGERFTCGFRCDVVVSGRSRVTEISLDQAGYIGSLSSTSWNLQYLDTLDLSNNFFSGPIPTSLSNLTWLRRFGCRGTPFPARYSPRLAHFEEVMKEEMEDQAHSAWGSRSRTPLYNGYPRRRRLFCHRRRI